MEMTTTPFAAAVPYSAAADGPFTISMFSISSGLMSLIRLGCAPPVNRLELPTSAVMRTPSMMKIGSLLRLIDAIPRMRVRLPAPVCVPVVTTRFDVLAASTSATVVIGETSTVLATLIAATVLPTSLRSCVPVAVTTTGVRSTATLFSATSTAGLSPALIRTASLPSA